MKNEKLSTKEQLPNNAQTSWDSLKDVPFSPQQEQTWANELHTEKQSRKEAIDSYKAASKSFRLDFNERATGPEQFEEWINSEEPGITSEEIEYEGQPIKVYHLTGHKFLALVHCIDYRGSKADKIIYPEVYKKSKAIRDDPSNWITIPNENNPKNVSNGLAKSSSANNISSSLVSDKVPDGHWGDDEKAIYYGFSNLGLRGIVKSGRGDMGVHQGWTSEINTKEDARTIQSIDEIEKTNGPNEVAINRYEEDSKRTILPDFIYCPNSAGTTDDLTEAQKRHAAFFNIPIVILHREHYT